MGKPLRREATYDDLLKVPDNLVAEIVEGELFASPRPATPHARATGALFRLLSNAFDDGDGPGGWWILIEPELHLGRNVLVPDLAAWRRERMPVIPNVAAIELPPDWVCEVVSPKTSRLDRIKKLPVYARNGVQYAWIVDPIEKFLEVWIRQGDLLAQYSTHVDDDVIRAVPFDAIEIELRRLWI